MASSSPSSTGSAYSPIHSSAGLVQVAGSSTPVRIICITPKKRLANGDKKPQTPLSEKNLAADSTTTSDGKPMSPSTESLETVFALCENCGQLSETFIQCDYCRVPMIRTPKTFSHCIKSLNPETEPISIKPSLNKVSTTSGIATRPSLTAKGFYGTKIVSSLTKEPKPPIYKRMKVEPPKAVVCLTLSSDDEDELEKQKISKNKIKESETGCDSPDAQAEKKVEFYCRSIRIGSFKVQSPEPPSLLFEISEKSVSFTVPTVLDEQTQVEVTIPMDDIPSVLASFDKRLPVIYIYTTPGCGSIIRSRLKMTNKSLCYYDPCVSDETSKRITVLPVEINDNQKETIKGFFDSLQSSKFLEIDTVMANEILVKSTPVQSKGQHLTKLSRVITRSNSEVVPKGAERVILYPMPPEVGGITVTTEDLECLKEEEFLNDVIIDFYLKYLFYEKFSKDIQSKIHIFSSFFFNRLTQRLVKSADGNNLQPNQLRHTKVKTWTRHVNIFEKDFLIVPINQRSHWFLAIICFPGLAKPESPGDASLENEDEDTSELFEGEPSAEELFQEVKDDLEDPLPPIPQPLATPRRPLQKNDSTGLSSILSYQSDEASSNEATEENLLANNTSLGPSTLANPKSPKVPQCSAIPSKGESKSIPTDATPSKKSTVIIILDSLPEHTRWRVVTVLREYLECEYESKMKIKGFNFRNTVKGLHANVPRQTNFSDCGVYMLQYAQNFFTDPLKSYHSSDTWINWFTEEEIKGKRKQIIDTIFDIQKKQSTNNNP